MLDIHSALKIFKDSAISHQSPILRRTIARHGVKLPIGCDLVRLDATRRVTPRFLFFQLHSLGRATWYRRRKAAKSLPTSARRRYLIGKQLAATMSKRRGRWGWWWGREKDNDDEENRTRNRYVSREHLWPMHPPYNPLLSLSLSTFVASRSLANIFTMKTIP